MPDEQFKSILELFQRTLVEEEQEKKQKKEEKQRRIFRKTSFKFEIEQKRIYPQESLYLKCYLGHLHS